MPTEEDLQRMLDEREALEASQEGPEAPPDVPVKRKPRDLFAVSEPAPPRPPRPKPPLGVIPTAEELAAAAMAPMTAALERAGATDDMIAQVIVQGMQAEKVVTATHEGKITDAAKYPDAKIHLEAAALAAKLKGHLVDRQIRDVRQQSIIYLGGIDRTDPASQPGGPVHDIGQDGKK